MKRVLRLSLTFLSLFALFTAGFRILKLDDLADYASIEVAKQTLMLVSDRTLDSNLNGDNIWFQVQRHTMMPVREDVRQKVVGDLQKKGKTGAERILRRVMVITDVSIKRANVNSNLPMFLAVVVALATSRRGKMALVLAVGSTAMIVLDGLSLASLIWQYPTVDIPENFAFHVLKLISIWSEGGWLMAPIFIGALIALTWLSEKEPAPTATPPEVASGEAE